MPHLIIEHSEALSSQIKSSKLGHKLHKLMLESGLFDPEAVKTRIHPVLDSWVGIQDGDFVHVSVALLEGRTEEQRSKLSSQIFGAIKEDFGDIQSVSVEVKEMLKATYSKG